MWKATENGIRDALKRIDENFLNMPVLRSPALIKRLGADLLLKNETANPIRSFKGRGACNYVGAVVNAVEARDGIVCASAGNFGQGMAWAARIHDISVTVFAATSAVQSKIDAMRALGAIVVLTGDDFDAAKDAASAYSKRKGMLYVEDGSNAEIAEGAGTLALELTEQEGPFDLVLCPLGNGALAAGVGCWVRHSMPEAEVIAVSARGAPAMARSVKENAIIVTPTVDTIADGIAIRVPIPSAVDAVRDAVHDVVLVGDDHIRTAVKLLQATFGLTVEPAGAAGLAALIAQPELGHGKRVAIPLCGGNV